METRTTVIVIIATVAVGAITSTGPLPAPVDAACSGNPHDFDSGSNGNPHDLVGDFHHHQAEDCPGGK